MNRTDQSDPQTRKVALYRVEGAICVETTDSLAVEEPLKIQVEGQSVAVVMRTPGHDRELAAGFLVTEGLVKSAHDIISIEGEGSVSVRLRNPYAMDIKKLTRHVFSSSSCGICSKSSIDAVQVQFPKITHTFKIAPGILLGLPPNLTSAQEAFKQTGGLHACALFDETGRLLVVREDVGRHNALDKVIGWALLENRLPLARTIILLSGRASFEMMQKALAAGIPIVAAISAPSSLAVEFARDSGQMLAGFVRGGRMNIYTGVEFLREAVAPSLVSGHKL